MNRLDADQILDILEHLIEAVDLLNDHPYNYRAAEETGGARDKLEALRAALAGAEEAG